MTALAPTDQLPTRMVDCPTCGGPSMYATSNAFRPFCSERCKQIDLGAWASEQFTLPAPAQTDPALSESGHPAQ